MVVVYTAVSYREYEVGKAHTSFLLLQSHFIPVDLHAISQLHPELRLFLRWHAFPSLFNSGQGRVGDGVSASGLRLTGHGSMMNGGEGGSESSGGGLIAASSVDELLEAAGVGGLCSTG